MAESQPMNAVPGYVIYRDTTPGEPFDPTSALIFFPPKGSDELFDALRSAFPLTRTHSERMRDAIIQFLLEERQDDQSNLATVSPATSIELMPLTWPALPATSTVSSASASVSASGSNFNSPETLNMDTPASCAAPVPTRQASSTTSLEQSPPTLDTMTGVFSLSFSSQPKQHVRRKMTEAEKIEYRKRRIVKACDKCAKRKRKCPHNQAEMEVLTPSTKSSSRVCKSTSPKSSKRVMPVAHQQKHLVEAITSVEDVDYGFPNTQSLGPAQDFTMFDDPFSDLDMNASAFNDYYGTGCLSSSDVSPRREYWMYCDQAAASGSMSSEWFNLDYSDDVPMHIYETNHFQDHLSESLARERIMPRYIENNHVNARDMREGQEDNFRRCILHHSESHTAGGDDCDLPRQQLRLSRPLIKQGTASAARVQGIGSNSSKVNGNRRPPQDLSPVSTWRLIVLRLTGTARALRAFTRKLDQRQERLPDVSLNINAAANAVRSHGVHVHASQYRTLHINNALTCRSSSQHSTTHQDVLRHISAEGFSQPESAEQTQQQYRRRMLSEREAISSSSSSSRSGVNMKIILEATKSESSPTASQQLPTLSAGAGNHFASKDSVPGRFKNRSLAARAHQDHDENLPATQLLDRLDSSQELYMARKRASVMSRNVFDFEAFNSPRSGPNGNRDQQRLFNSPSNVSANPWRKETMELALNPVQALCRNPNPRMITAVSSTTSANDIVAAPNVFGQRNLSVAYSTPSSAAAANFQNSSASATISGLLPEVFNAAAAAPGKVVRPCSNAVDGIHDDRARDDHGGLALGAAAGLHCEKISPPATTQSSTLPSHEDQLSDHQRFRDYCRRPLSVLLFLSVAMCFFAAAVFVLGHCASSLAPPSMLLLALAKIHCPTSMSAQFSTKNRSCFNFDRCTKGVKPTRQRQRTQLANRGPISGLAHLLACI